MQESLCSCSLLTVFLLCLFTNNSATEYTFFPPIKSNIGDKAIIESDGTIEYHYLRVIDHHQSVKQDNVCMYKCQGEVTAVAVDDSGLITSQQYVINEISTKTEPIDTPLLHVNDIIDVSIAPDGKRTYKLNNNLIAVKDLPFQLVTTLVKGTTQKEREAYSLLLPQSPISIGDTWFVDADEYVRMIQKFYGGDASKTMVFGRGIIEYTKSINNKEFISYGTHLSVHHLPVPPQIGFELNDSSDNAEYDWTVVDPVGESGIITQRPIVEDASTYRSSHAKGKAFQDGHIVDIENTRIEKTIRHEHVTYEDK